MFNAVHDLFTTTNYPMNRDIVYSDWFNKYRDDFDGKLPIFKRIPDHQISFDEENVRKFDHDDLDFMLHYFYSLELEYYAERDFGLTDFNFDYYLSEGSWFDFERNLFSHCLANKNLILASDVAKMIISNEDWYDRFVEAKLEERMAIANVNRFNERTYMNKLISEWMRNVIKKRSKILFNHLDLSSNIETYEKINSVLRKA